MNTKVLFDFLYVTIVLTGCGSGAKKNSSQKEIQSIDMQVEEQAILKTLNDETGAVFQRDYDTWQSKWVHLPTMTKVYEDLSGGESSTSTGWEEISQFVKDFFVAHLEPEPVPEMLSEFDVRIEGNTAEVIYEHQDELRGRKVENRTIRKVNGQWKIAGMKTTIYGFKG